MPQPVEVAAGTSDNAIVAPNIRLKLLGFTVAETASPAAAAEVSIRHGTSATDPLLVPPMNLDADGFDGWDFSHGIDCPNGIYIDRVAGNTTLVLYIDPLEAVP